MINKYWFHLIGLISIIAIGSALIAEHLFYIEPCKLCLKQREPYYVIIIVTCIFILLKLQKKIWFYIIIQAISVYGLFYSMWHVGIENKILPGPSGCSGGLDVTSDATNLKEQILSKAVISCEDVIWSFFGLSAATINSLILFLIFTINAIYLKNEYGSKKKESN